MGKVCGSQLVAKALKNHGVDTFFFLTGAPTWEIEQSCIDVGMRGVDVRHEQAAVMMAHACARLLNRPGVAMSAPGPGATNLVTGVANALVDCAPIVVMAGSSSQGTWGRGAFQEMDQLALFKPITKWAERITRASRIPEIISVAFRQATSGKPGPVYLDLPGDVIFEEVDEESVDFPDPDRARPTGRPEGDPDLVKAAVKLLAESSRPIIVTGSGVFWSDAGEQLRQFVETTGIPFWTSPQGRGILPDDHPLAFLTARSAAFREADCLLLVGTRLNYMLNYGLPSRFAPDLKLIQVDIDPLEIGRNRPADIGIVGDAAAVLAQLTREAEGTLAPWVHADWVEHLRLVEQRKHAEHETSASTDQVPIHPLRLCKEIRDFVDRDAVVVVDGHEILQAGRQVIPTFVARHRLNSGPMGTMGVGLPFGLGAKVARPDKQVLVLHGDGSFGLNAMELDTAVRHRLPVVTVISNNGGWTGDLNRPGRDLGHPHYERMAEGLGCHGEYVERPEEIRPALERAFASGLPAVVNVITAPVRIATQRFGGWAM